MKKHIENNKIKVKSPCLLGFKVDEIGERYISFKLFKEETKDKELIDKAPEVLIHISSIKHLDNLIEILQWAKDNVFIPKMTSFPEIKDNQHLVIYFGGKMEIVNN